MEKKLFSLVCSILICTLGYAMDDGLEDDPWEVVEDKANDGAPTEQKRVPSPLAISIEGSRSPSIPIGPVSPPILAALAVATKTNDLPPRTPPSSPLSSERPPSPTSLALVSLESGTLPAPKKVSPLSCPPTSPPPNSIELHQRRPPAIFPASYQTTGDSLTVVKSKSSLNSPSEVEESPKCNLWECLFGWCNQGRSR